MRPRFKKNSPANKKIGADAANPIDRGVCTR